MHSGKFQSNRAQFRDKTLVHNFGGDKIGKNFFAKIGNSPNFLAYFSLGARPIEFLVNLPIFSKIGKFFARWKVLFWRRRKPLIFKFSRLLFCHEKFEISLTNCKEIFKFLGMFENPLDFGSFAQELWLKFVHSSDTKSWMHFILLSGSIIVLSGAQPCNET